MLRVTCHYDVFLHNILRQFVGLQPHPNQRRETQIWNRGGRVTTREDPEAQVWFGDLQVPTALRGIRVLGTPLGTAEFVQAQPGHRGVP